MSRTIVDSTQDLMTIIVIVVKATRREIVAL